jgi:hypothetical protein
VGGLTVAAIFEATMSRGQLEQWIVDALELG